LPWRQDGDSLIITLPDRWQSPADRPCELPVVFKLDCD
jgi:hypothetical protein